jgi:tetratricopeptide (TPR) repeat protein/DNA-binding CsgD family transcriptional regulator
MQNRNSPASLFILILLCCSCLKAEAGIKFKFQQPSVSDTTLVNELNRQCWQNRRKDPAASIKQAYSALAISQKLNYQNGLAYACKGIGGIHWMRGVYDSAIWYYNKSLQAFEELGNKMETGNLHNLYGLLYTDMGKYSLSESSYREAGKIFREINDVEGIALVQGNLGIIYYEQGRLDEALENYLSALPYHERVNDSFGLSNVYTNIGLIYAKQKNFRKALANHHYSLEIDRRTKDLPGQGKCLTNIGVSYYDMGDMDSSLIYHKQAQDIFRQVGDDRGLSHSLINIGEIEFQWKKYGDAYHTFKQSLALKNKIGDNTGKTIVLMNLGRLFMEQELYSEALPSLEQAKETADLTGSMKYQAEAAYFLSAVYEHLLQPAKALQYFKEFSTKNDSMKRKDATDKLLSLQVAFETSKKEQEIVLLQQEALLENNKKVAYASGSVLLLLLGVVVVSRQRLNHKKEKKLAEIELEKNAIKQKAIELELSNLEIRLEYNQKALHTYTRKLIEKNELFEQLKKQMEEQPPEQMDPASEPESEEVRAGKIGRLTGSRIVTEDDWEEFKKLYTNVYPEFFVRIKELYPSITQAEIRLAALIKLRLDSREIASMTGISADSVKKARQRLRKKMELQVNDDLDQHITSLADVAKLAEN